jgi:hypothetical protein
MEGDEIKLLSVENLMHRMDSIRITAQVEKYGESVFYEHMYQNFPLVSQISKTLKFQELNDSEKISLVDGSFRYLLQMDLIGCAGGFSNALLYNSTYDEIKSWKSPNFRLRDAAIKQYEIVASRIALECFFDLLSLAFNKKRLEGKSKFKSFKKFVLQQENPSKYFVGHVIKAFQFDRDHRQNEVHGTSRFAKSILRLEVPTYEENNLSLGLVNILLGVWTPFLQIMNDEKPNSISVFTGLENFAENYFKSLTAEINFDSFIESLIENNLS